MSNKLLYEKITRIENVEKKTWRNIDNFGTALI